MPRQPATIFEIKQVAAISKITKHLSSQNTKVSPKATINRMLMSWRHSQPPKTPQNPHPHPKPTPTHPKNLQHYAGQGWKPSHPPAPRPGSRQAAACSKARLCRRPAPSQGGGGWSPAETRLFLLKNKKCAFNPPEEAPWEALRTNRTPRNKAGGAGAALLAWISEGRQEPRGEGETLVT